MCERECGGPGHCHWQSRQVRRRERRAAGQAISPSSSLFQTGNSKQRRGNWRCDQGCDYTLTKNSTVCLRTQDYFQKTKLIESADLKNMILILMIPIPVVIYTTLENSRFLGKVANGVVSSSFSPSHSSYQIWGPTKQSQTRHTAEQHKSSSGIKIVAKISYFESNQFPQHAQPHTVVITRPKAAT